MSIPQPLQAVLGDPNVAYLLFVIGIVGVVAEFYHPGTLVPGITGTVALILAFVGFSLLPVNWAGVALILLGVGLLLAEVHTPGIGVLGAGGAVAFVAGSALLFTPLGATGPRAQPVNPWLVALGTAAVIPFFLVLVRAALRTRKLPVATGREALIGKEGVATSDLTPRGTVRVNDEDWTAVAEFQPIAAGETVEVIGVEGITLQVHRPHEWRLADVPQAQIPSA
ncbi:MAG TPA: NfeD family protein [Ktedonobacterales bacterium]|jgi:membrane-bound serine protease (ClpP class)|nr:NfeD family protein [Ktedonobacterales bacterium]